MLKIDQNVKNSMKIRTKEQVTKKPKRKPYSDDHIGVKGQKVDVIMKNSQTSKVKK